MKLFLVLLPLFFLIVSHAADVKEGTDAPDVEEEIAITETTDMNKIKTWNDYGFTCDHEACKTTCKEEYGRESECERSMLLLKHTCYCIIQE